jgi:hypothetical protein
VQLCPRVAVTQGALASALVQRRCGHDFRKDLSLCVVADHVSDFRYGVREDER